MNRAKQKRLEALGWRMGSAVEFLKLTPHEATLVEVKARAKSISRRS